MNILCASLALLVANLVITITSLYDLSIWLFILPWWLYKVILVMGEGVTMLVMVYLVVI